MPAPYGGDDFVGIGRPSEGFGIVVGIGEKRLMAACSSTIERNTPRLSRRLVSLAKKPSTALSQEHEVGV